jgi:hypothetical protein
MPSLYLLLLLVCPIVSAGGVNSIPVISQFKSLVEVMAGDAEAARRTQEDFSKQCPVVSQARSAVHAAQGDNEQALEVQKEFAKGAEAMCDGLPVVGHIKGVVHYAQGDSEHGDRCMMGATRSLAVVAAGVATGGLGAGVYVAAGAGVSSAVAVDAVYGVMDKNEDGSFKCHGVIDNVSKLTRGEDVIDSVFELVMDVAGNAGGGVAAAKGKAGLRKIEIERDIRKGIQKDKPWASVKDVRESLDTTKKTVRHTVKQGMNNVHMNGMRNEFGEMKHCCSSKHRENYFANRKKNFGNPDGFTSVSEAKRFAKGMFEVDPATNQLKLTPADAADIRSGKSTLSRQATETPVAATERNLLQERNPGMVQREQWGLKDCGESGSAQMHLTASDGRITNSASVVRTDVTGPSKERIPKNKDTKWAYYEDKKGNIQKIDNIKAQERCRNCKQADLGIVPTDYVHDKSLNALVPKRVGKLTVIGAELRDRGRRSRGWKDAQDSKNINDIASVDNVGDDDSDGVPEFDKNFEEVEDSRSETAAIIGTGTEYLSVWTQESELDELESKDQRETKELVLRAKSISAQEEIERAALRTHAANCGKLHEYINCVAYFPNGEEYTCASSLKDFCNNEWRDRIREICDKRKKIQQRLRELETLGKGLESDLRLSAIIREAKAESNTSKE